LAPEILQLKKEIRKAELERELAGAKMPAEVAVLVAAAQELGEEGCDGCPHEEDGVCTYWQWEAPEEIPQGIGEPVSVAKDEWRMRPSVLYRAMCTVGLRDAIWHLDYVLDNTPLHNLRESFSCECRTSGMVAVHIKCTNCGKETWRGWWPKK